MTWEQNRHRHDRFKTYRFDDGVLHYRSNHKQSRLAVFLKILKSKRWAGARVSTQEDDGVHYNVLTLGTAVLRVRV